MTANRPGRAGRCENYCSHVQCVTSWSLNVFVCFVSSFGVMLLQRLWDCQPMNLRWKFEMVHSHMGMAFSNYLDLYPSAPQEKQLNNCRKLHPEIQSHCLLHRERKELAIYKCVYFFFSLHKWAQKASSTAAASSLVSRTKEVWQDSSLPHHSQRMQASMPTTCLGPGGWFKSQLPLIMSRSFCRNLNHEECKCLLCKKCAEC